MNWALLVDENKDDPNMIHAILNILLVMKKVRPAMLIEGMNFPRKTRKEKLLKLLQLAKDSGLKFILENQEFWRYLVATPRVIDLYTKKPTEKNLGKVLGFYCYRHKYGDQNRARVSAVIKMGSIDLVVEVCELKKVNKDLTHFHGYYEDLLQRIAKVIVPLGLPIPSLTFTEMSSRTLRIDALERWDVPYIRSNVNDYIMDLDNFWAPDSIFAQKFPKLITEDRYQPMLKFVWKLFVKKEPTLDLPFPGEKINDEMGKLDRELFGKGVPTETEIVAKWNEKFGKYVKLEP